jgi:hypothetical protein
LKARAHGADQERPWRRHQDAALTSRRRVFSVLDHIIADLDGLAGHSPGAAEEKTEDEEA